MKNLKDIIEGQNFLVNKKPKNRQQQYEYHPQDRKELVYFIKDLIKQGETDLNCIDVSKITDMKLLFYQVNSIGSQVSNIDISGWDVSNVTTMSSMFYGCDKFNGDISDWNVSNVENMYNMFGHCKNFDCDLTKWKVNPNTTDISDMFDDCETLIKNNKIPKWYK